MVQSASTAAALIEDSSVKEIDKQTEKYKVGVMGGTGTVGQRFLSLLQNHPWFTVAVIGASERSAGKPYAEAVNWKLSSPLPSIYKRMIVADCLSTSEIIDSCDLVFSALDASVAGAVESEIATAGVPVFSNAKNHRRDPDVPILLPFVNHDHLKIVGNRMKGGFIVTNANCSSTGLTIALAPIYKSFNGISKVNVSTLQAISGAGYPGVASMDIVDNVIPFISGEEEKIEWEPNKILGSLSSSGISSACMTISAACHRVSVSDGHTMSVSIELPINSITAEMSKATKTQKTIECLESFTVSDIVAKLPSCPSKPICVRHELDRPQPRLDKNEGSGMTTVVGRIRPCSVADVKMTVVTHNTVIGAAGGSILNAEFAVSQNYVTRRSNSSSSN